MKTPPGGGGVEDWIMQISNEFCESVIAEYAKRFTDAEIQNGYKGMDVYTARIAMEVFRIALERLSQQENQDSQAPVP